MKTALYSLLACLLLFPVAFADTLNNGDFETGLLSPWASIGTAGITGPITTPLTIDPFGYYQGYATAGVGATGVTLYTEAVGDIDIVSFAGITDPSIIPSDAYPYTGSAIQQVFTANPGDTLSLRYNYATNSGDNRGGDSSGFIVIAGSSFLSLSIFSDDALEGSGWRSTGYNEFTFPFTTGGQFALSVGVLDSPDTGATSYMFVDNAEINAIPEPSTLALMSIGIVALFGCGWRRRKAE